MQAVVLLLRSNHGEPFRISQLTESHELSLGGLTVDVRLIGC